MSIMEVHGTGCGSPKGGGTRLYYRHWTALFYQRYSEWNAV